MVLIVLPADAKPTGITRLKLSADEHETVTPLVSYFKNCVNFNFLQKNMIPKLYQKQDSYFILRSVKGL